MLQKQLLVKLPSGIHGPPEKQQGNHVSILKDWNLVKWTTMKYGYVVVESHSLPELPLSSTEMFLYPEIRTLQEMLWSLLQKPKKRKNLYLLSPQETFLILFLNQKQFSKTTWRRVEWYTISWNEVPCNIYQYCTFSLFWCIKIVQSPVNRLPLSSSEGNLFTTS